MCRYAMTKYKPHYACFHCRKTFKRKLLHDVDRDETQSVEAKCPQCGGLMADMGLDFEAPKMKDVEAWAHLKKLYSVGITFHSCGCSGPGYIPNTKEELINYFREKLDDFLNQQKYWRKRFEPEDQPEIDREKSKNWEYLGRIPSALKTKKGAVRNQDGLNFWTSRIQEIEQKLRVIGKE